jgi:DNA-binding MarR family transcriptional regulator
MAKPAIRLPATETRFEEFFAAAWQLVRRLRSEANDDGLTWSQLAALSRLRKQGPMTTAELARAESVKPQSMGATLAVLEEQGLVDRRPHPSDGRQVLFAVTKAWIAQRETRNRRKRAWLKSALAQLEYDDRRALLDAIEPMRRLARL